ncbi:hypothetical protein HID58_081692 [Brassica napus]|uniref:Prokaryotic-type class I peptide chain release factors domain-containing protein n=1 Tax=Brassica napus TaxID=3708 RepID=A0ABQ7Y8G9_BRANA|nr:hypothetical protein HID58_081692 [Brassica napus]
MDYLVLEQLIIMGVRYWWRRGFFVCFRHFQNVSSSLYYWRQKLVMLQFVSMENLNSRVEFTGFSVFLSLRNLDVCAVSVAILPQADEVDVQLRNEDLRIDTYRSGGCGGQHANTTNSAVRIINPSSNWDHGLHPRRKNTTYGINKAKALKVLCAKLYEIERLRLQSSRSKLRSEQWRPIWTNPYVQFSIEDMMEGENLDTFIDALLLHQEMDAIASFSSTS